MRDKLRRRYLVQRELARNGCYEGYIALSELQRLSELLHPGKSALAGSRVSLSFEFVRGDFDVPMLLGRLETSLELECQRCLKSMELPINLDFRLMIDADEELVRDCSIDTIYSDDGYIDINEVVEEELMLSLPLVALHDDQSCNQYWRETAPDMTGADKENPFAVLKRLKTTS